MKKAKRDFVSKMIETFRKEAKIETRSAFADALGVSRQYYSYVANGKYFPNFTMVFALHKMDFDVRRLFGK